MVQAFDHRAASITINPLNLKRPAQTEDSTLEQHQIPNWYPIPQYWVDSKEVNAKADNIPWYLAFKDITATTNIRTMVAAIIPRTAVGETAPVILPKEYDDKTKILYKNFVPLLLANFNSYIFDYIARQKVQATHIKWYIVEQLPVIPPKEFEKKLGKTTIGDFVRQEVLKLTYTANDMEPFARDMGYEGKPFIWDEVERRHSKARLDALFFNLYDINRDDASYILDTFPIVKRQDEAEFGSYRTRDLILAYMNALKAGDTDIIIKV